MMKIVALLSLLACSPMTAHAGEPVEQATDEERPAVPVPARPDVVVPRVLELAPPAPEFLPPAPVVVRYEQRRMTRLLTAGAVLWGAVYIPTLAAGVRVGQPLLAIPFVGPFVDMPRLGLPTGFPPGAMITAVLVVDGVAQIAGATMAIVGATTKRRVPMLSNAVFAPMVTTGGSGLVVAGRF